MRVLSCRGASCLAAITWIMVVPSGVELTARPSGQGVKRGTVWDGVYTEAQAERGRTAYAQSCASCHADDLRGRGTAPSLVEDSFAFLWSDMTIGDLFERTRTLMPSDRPNSLPGQSYADIIAFIVQKNGFPAGGKELGTDVEALGQLLITTVRPQDRP